MQEELIPHLFRTEYRKIVSVLCRQWGISHMEAAEDITSDIFLLASELWGLKGLPENPVAWLYVSARNKANDYFRRHTVLQQKIKPHLLQEDRFVAEMDIDLSENNITDSQLQMIFTICNPVIPAEAQIGLALRILCGFGIDEIADAFITNRETINKRLFRAREKLRGEKVKIAFPREDEIPQRLQSVLTTLYLLFNEGYYSASQKITLRKDLCEEAMRLTFMLTENPATSLPQVKALFALMCFHASRFEARLTEGGETILYNDQDVTRWDDALIRKGEEYLGLAAIGDKFSKYHIEAGIAAWHTVQTDSGEKWENILQLYNHLLTIDYSPVTALNRTFALSKANGKEEAIAAAEKLALTDNHLYFALLGELYTGIDNAKAYDYLRKAHDLARSAADKMLLEKKMEKL